MAWDTENAWRPDWHGRWRSHKPGQALVEQNVARPLLRVRNSGTTERLHIISEKLQFAAIGMDGSVTDADIAPHLNLRPARPEEIAVLDDPKTEIWLQGDFEQMATEFSTVDLARTHAAAVRAR